MPTTATRHLYRIAAVVDERHLHSCLVMFAAIKAMDVQVLPVTADADPPSAPRGARSSSRVVSPATQMIRIFAAQAAEPFPTSDILAARPDSVSKGSLNMALTTMAKSGELKRIKHGLYKRGKHFVQPEASPAPAPAKTNGAAAPLSVTKTGRLRPGAGPEILFDVLRHANGTAVPKKALFKALRAKGVSPKSLSGIFKRAKSKLKQSSGGYQLRGA